MAVEYNEFVAQATNRQTLINILRARDREPLHFTTITSVHGQATLTGNAGLTVGLPGVEKAQELVAGSRKKFATTGQTIGSDTWTPSIGVSVATGTTFDIGINATDDFWKGILTPLSPATLAYYLDQGWPPDLLAYLFIERIDYSVSIKSKDGSAYYDRIASVRNVVDDKNEISRFRSVLACRPLILSSRPSQKAALPFWHTADLNGIAKDTVALARVPEADGPKNPDPTRPAVMLPPGATPVGPYVQLGDDGTTTTASLRPLATGCPTSDALIQTGVLARVARQYWRGYDPESPVELVPLASVALRQEGRIVGAPGGGDTTTSDGAADRALDACRPLISDAYRCDIVTSISFRSIEAAIYYLGEYIRVTSRRPNLPSGGPIITVLKAGDPAIRSSQADAFVEVDYKGAHYLLPSSGEAIGPLAGRSSEVLTLVQQMLNLHRTAKDLPTTPSVRIVN